MSILRSYFNRNNTIVSGNYVNTGRNPVTQLNFGNTQNIIAPTGYSRFIFDLDLSELEAKVATGEISTGCTNGFSGITHTLTMTNTSTFDLDLLNTYMSDEARRATSFDLILFRIPKVSGSTGLPQTWDEGVGYDYYNFQATRNSATGQLSPDETGLDKAFSDRASNWYQRSTILDWSTDGVYDNTNSGTGSTVNYSALTIVDVQHFEFGNEDINFDMTNEINSILAGSLTGVTGWGVAYYPQLENITGLTENYSVGFFSRHTQTFYQPYLLTNYDDLIDDDRNTFTKGKINNLYLYVYQNGDFANLDQLPVVDVKDANGNVIPGLNSLPTCLRTKGVYEVSIPDILPNLTPCIYYDNWTGLVINGQSIPNVQNEFVLLPIQANIVIGSQSQDPSNFGFTFYGINQDEKILNTDVRKVGVVVKRAYTTNTVLQNVQAFYRVYVMEGQTEVQVQDWTKINRTPNEFYFIFDMKDKIPNEYFVDIRVNTNGEKDTYKRQLKFQIVNKK